MFLLKINVKHRSIKQSPIQYINIVLCHCNALKYISSSERYFLFSSIGKCTQVNNILKYITCEVQDVNQDINDEKLISQIDAQEIVI